MILKTLAIKAILPAQRKAQYLSIGYKNAYYGKKKAIQISKLR